LVFLDETGLNTKMTRLYGRSPVGERCLAAVPHGHWQTATFIAGLRHDRLSAPWVVDAPHLLKRNGVYAFVRKASIHNSIRPLPPCPRREENLWCPA